MFKSLLLSSILSSLLFANNVKEVNIVEKPNIPQAVTNVDINKIIVKGDSIVIEDKILRDKIILLIKNDFLVKNPNIAMEINEDQIVQNLDINIDACSSCHGYDFDKQALNKSKIISKMSEEEILSSLTGYKDGTYGGAMKSLMKSQVMKYTDDELKEIAKYIVKITKDNELKKEGK